MHETFDKVALATVPDLVKGRAFCILVKKHSRSLFHCVFANFELVLRPHSVCHGQNACRMHYPRLWSTICMHETFDKVTLATVPDLVKGRAFCISTNFGPKQSGLEYKNVP